MGGTYLRAVMRVLYSSELHARWVNLEYAPLKDKIYEQVDKNTAARQRARRCASTSDVSLCRRRVRSFYRKFREEAERPKLQQQFVGLERGLATVADE